MTLIKWKPRHLSINDFDQMINNIFNDGWNINSYKTNYKFVQKMFDFVLFFTMMLTICPCKGVSMIYSVVNGSTNHLLLFS